MSDQIIKILLIDDEEDILEFLGYNLTKEGYIVYTAKSGGEGLKKAKEIIPNLIILDVMMPEMDGIETCYELRKIDSLKNTIITFLTARSEDYSEISGLEAGGDDYISKPIKPRLLVTKVKALLRRGISEKQSTLIISGDFKIDEEKHLVIFKEDEYQLPKKEFKLLKLLISKPGKVFNRDEILSNVWGNDVVIGDRTIDVHIRKLRERFGEGHFTTIKGVGYKFESYEN